jgi:hypothetical protein
VGLGARQRRHEDADQPEVALDGAHDVLVVLVEHIERSRLQRPGFAGGDLDHFALASEAVIRLRMMLIVKPLLRSLLEDGVVQRITKPVRLEQQPSAFPSRSLNVSRTFENLVQRSDDHG